MKDRETPEFTIHAHVAAELIQFFYTSTMYLLYAVFDEIMGLSVKMHRDIRCVLTTMQNFSFVQEAIKTNDNFAIIGIASLPHAPCIFIRQISVHYVLEGNRDQLSCVITSFFRLIQKV